MYSFSVEFGDAVDNYHPTPARYPKIEREIHAAILAFVRQIAIWRGLMPSTTSPPPPTTTSSPFCFIATAAFGSVDDPDVQFLREWRDTLRMHPLFGNAMRNLESLYYRISPRIARYLRRHEVARRLVRQQLLVPLVATLRRLFPKIDRHAK